MAAVAGVLAMMMGVFPVSVDDPSEDPSGASVVLPSYVTESDGTRWSCVPQGCWRDHSGLPSYLVPALISS